MIDYSNFNLTYLDLELQQPSNKIIEIGWCIANPFTGEISCRNNAYVKIDEPLAPFITVLTAITDEKLQSEGVTIDEAIKRLIADHRTYKSQMNPVQWGVGDVEAIKDQAIDSDLKREVELSFGRRFIDVKMIYQAYRMANRQEIKSGLAKSMLKLGLKFEGRKHTAIDDAYNTFRIHQKLLEIIKK